MAESPLTCEACKAAPAEYLMVAEFPPPAKRAKQMQCGDCVEWARRMLFREVLHVYALTPVPVTEGAHRG